MPHAPRFNKQWLALGLVLLVALLVGGLWFAHFVRRTINEIDRRAAQPLSAIMPAAVDAPPRQWRRLWTWTSGAPLAGAPTPSQGGWVGATVDGSVFALNANGRPRWTTSCSNLVFAGAVAAAGPWVVAAASGGEVLAFDAFTGKPAWRASGAGGMRQGPVALRRADGGWTIVVLAAADGVLRAFDGASGRALWTAAATNRSDGPPAGDSERVVFGNCDAALHVFRLADGARLASIAAGPEAQMAGGVLLMGTRAFAGARDGKLRCFDLAAAAVAWSAPLGAGESFVTPVAAGQAIITGDADGTVLAVERASGAPLWRTALSNAVTALYARQDTLIAAAGGALVIMRASDGARRAALPISDAVLGPVGDEHGVIAVGDEAGNVIAIGGAD